MLPGTPPLPDVNWLRVHKYTAALADPRGKWADPEERAAAGRTGRTFPGRRKHDLLPGGDAGEQVLAARKVHAGFAAQAVTAGTAGVVFASCGFPCDPDPHTGAMTADPAARFVFADESARVIAACRAEFGHQQAVTWCRASLLDPQDLLGRPQVRALLAGGAPIQVQAQLAGHWWPPELARHLVGEYARLLPSGSTLLLSLGIPDGDTPAGKEFAAGLEALGGAPVYWHREADIASWFTGAGLEFTGRGGAVKGVRGRGRPWAAMLAGPQSPGRIVYVTAVRP